MVYSFYISRGKQEQTQTNLIKFHILLADDGRVFDLIYTSFHYSQLIVGGGGFAQRAKPQESMKGPPETPFKVPLPLYKVRSLSQKLMEILRLKILVL